MGKQSGIKPSLPQRRFPVWMCRRQLQTGPFSSSLCVLTQTSNKLAALAWKNSQPGDRHPHITWSLLFPLVSMFRSWWSQFFLRISTQTRERKLTATTILSHQSWPAAVNPAIFSQLITGIKYHLLSITLFAPQVYNYKSTLGHTVTITPKNREPDKSQQNGSR